MPDLGAKYTDDQIIQMEKQLKSVYNQAYKDILQKQKDFNEKYAVKEAKYTAQVANGKITQEQFDSWKKGQVFQGQQWQNKKKDILNTLYNSNKIATDIVNGKTQNVFTFNANYQSYELEHGAGVNFGFSLYDSATVVNLIKNDPQLLPKWKIDQPKDYTWNQKKLNRQVSLGVIEGESLDKIATRLTDSLVTQNFNKMRTFARTAMTGAQNSGRQMSLENAKALGIKVKKQWMATLDAHTRINHRILDGQKVETDDYFNANGMKIRYPGDPQAHPSMVYNCRCTMVGDIEDYPSTYNRYDNIAGKPIKNMSYKEWEEAKAATSANQTKSPNGIINGKDISETWKRREDQFDFEIEDVINAQGFDGKPRIVSREEFEKAVKAANGGNGFIAQRTYSAPDQETLDAYRDQLYYDKWYVDCSVGTAAYGQGMYASADFDGIVSDSTREANNFYKSMGESRGNKSAAVETFTLSSDAKIVEYDSLYDDFRRYGMEVQTKNGEIRSRERKNADKALAEILLKESGFENNAAAKTFLLGNLSIGNVDWVEMGNAYKELGPSSNSITSLVNDFYSRQPSFADKYVKERSITEIKDIGSYAAAKGYDAIKVSGRGVSGSTEVVILNRTKVIFKGD